jgi:hypothetical protein
MEHLRDATVVAITVRVLVPDLARLVRRGLAAGVSVGVASLAERHAGDRVRPPSAPHPHTGRQEERA